MSSTIVGGGSFDFSVPSTGGTWRWSVLANNIQGAGQFYSVTDILTPYGKIIDSAIPLPGNVVLSMAGSIEQVMQQLSAYLNVVGPSTFSITVTEGGPQVIIGSSQIQNSGAIGSFLTALASSDSPWLTATPAAISGLGRGQSGLFTLKVNPGILSATDSPYVGHVNLQNSQNPAITNPLTVSVIVLPRPFILASPSVINLTFYLITESSNGAEQLVITNDGPVTSTLDFTTAKLQNNSPWLAVTPTTGGPLNSGDYAVITLSLINSNVPRIPGTYTDILRINSYTASNNPVDIPVNLTVIGPIDP
jgi:hypothetical protein